MKPLLEIHKDGINKASRLIAWTVITLALSFVAYLALAPLVTP